MTTDAINARCSRLAYPWQSQTWWQWHSCVRNAVGVYDVERAVTIALLQPFSLYRRLYATQVRPVRRAARSA